jgi:hypothetical protein
MSDPEVKFFEVILAIMPMACLNEGLIECYKGTFMHSLRLLATEFKEAKAAQTDSLVSKLEPTEANLKNFKALVSDCAFEEFEGWIAGRLAKRHPSCRTSFKTHPRNKT